MSDEPRVHDLKTWPMPFAAVRAGLKPWELRFNDRDYRVGDVLRLREWLYNFDGGVYTGEVEERRVTWMLDGGFGLPKGYVIMSLAPSEQQPAEPRVEAVARIIDEADQAFGFQMALTRLVDGEHTYTLTFSEAVGEPPTEWGETEELYDRVAQVRATFRAIRVLSALAALPATSGGEEDGSSRDHDQTVSGALDTEAAVEGVSDNTELHGDLETSIRGDAQYISAALSWYYGGPASDDVKSAWNRICRALSSATPADREGSRDDHWKAKFEKAEAELAEARTDCHTAMAEGVRIAKDAGRMGGLLDRATAELRLWRSLVNEGGVPRYTVVPGAALNTVVTSTDRLLRSLTNQDRSTTVEGE